MIYNQYEKKGGLWAQELEKIHLFVKDKNINSIVEIGAGFSSTLFLNSICQNVTSYETSDKYIKLLKSKEPNLKIMLWDGEDLVIEEQVDLIFVDGPKGAINRKNSFIAASKKNSYIIVHDTGNEIIQNFCEVYLNDRELIENFSLEFTPSRRCNLRFYGKTE